MGTRFVVCSLARTGWSGYMTEELFYAIADEIAQQLEFGTPSPIH